MKKGITTPNLVYLLLAVIFIAILGGFIGLQMNGASLWGKYYSTSFASIIVNRAEHGDDFTLDIHKATTVASLNNEIDFNDTIQFDNQENEVCAKLSAGRKTCYSYFNNIDIVEKSVRYGDPVNLLKFKVVAKQIPQVPTETQNEITT